MKSLHFHPAARDELAAAAAWYEERRPGHGGRLVQRVQDVLRYVDAVPTSGTLWRGGPARTWRVVGFPFVIAYVVESDRVLVLAVAHAKRQPGYWTSRAP